MLVEIDSDGLRPLVGSKLAEDAVDDFRFLRHDLAP